MQCCFIARAPFPHGRPCLLSPTPSSTNHWHTSPTRPCKKSCRPRRKPASSCARSRRTTPRNPSPACAGTRTPAARVLRVFCARDSLAAWAPPTLSSTSCLAHLQVRLRCNRRPPAIQPPTPFHSPFFPADNAARSAFALFTQRPLLSFLADRAYIAVGDLVWAAAARSFPGANARR